jgi:lysophospholipase L1-like esterase
MSASYNGWIGYFASKMGISNNAIPTYAVSGNSCENVYSQLINSVSDGTTYLFATCGVNKFASANNTDWYKKIYEKAKEKGISHVYMTTMPPWNYINTLSSSTANTYCNKMQSDNSWLKNFDLQHSDLHVVDLWSMWHGTSGITVCGWRTDQTLTSDGVHPNSAGYTQWADEYYKLFSGSSGDFTIYNSWNFESEELGSYTDNEIAEDFDYTILYSHNSANIVNDVINGQNTKVMRITHEPNKVSVGFEMNVDLGHDYDELYVNYNWKFSNEFDSTAGGKMPGLGGLPNFGNDCPTGGQGFRVHNLFKQAGKMYSYHYDRTGPACPWSTEDNVNEIYMNNGQWYSITQRTVMNTFTNGVANADGIKEVWIDGRLIFQETNLKLMEVKSESMKIDAFRLANFYGGSIDYAPLNEVYGYIDNIKIYMPSDDSVSGHELHSTSLVIDTPDKITDRKVYYDYLKTTPGTFSNSQYGNTYSPCLDEAWLIDAGAGKRVSFTVNSGHIGHDFLFIYDGDKSDSNLIKLFNDDSLSGTYTSTGRYMFVRFSTTKGSGSTGWTGTLSFI